MNVRVEDEYGKTLDLTNDRDIDVTHISGLTSPPATIYSHPLTAADGDKYNRSRAEKRNIVITLVPRSSPEKCRLKIYSVFKVKRYIKMYFTTGAREVYIEGYVENIDGDLFENPQKLQISIICPFSYFRNVKDSVISFATIVDSFEFPFSIEEEGIIFSDATALIEKSLINDGDDDSGLIIELEAIASVVEPTIYNKTTRESFSLRFEMQAGDKITINSHGGQKSITLLRDGVETNIINHIYLGSKWPKLIVGDNVFTYTCAYGIDNLYVTVKTNSLYGGL